MHILSLIFIFCTINLGESYQLKKIWDNFKKELKLILHPKEEIAKKKRFHNCLKYIKTHNRNNADYKLGISHLCLLNEEELSRLMPDNNKVYDKNEYIKNLYKLKSLSLPKEIDWRKRGVVGRIKDQGILCGACYAYAAVGALEIHYAIKYKTKISFSEQQVVDCSEYSYKCDGGTPVQCYTYWIEHGTMKSSDYKATWLDHKCQYNKSTSIRTVVDYVMLPKSEIALQEVVATVGPVVSIFINPNKLRFALYRSGVLYDKNCNKKVAHHVVVVVGYGVTNTGEQYYIIKNSWGSYWGMKGFFYLARNKGNQCKIASRLSYPLL